MQDLKVSPLAPQGFGKTVPVDGVEMFAGASGETYGARANILLVSFARGTVAAGVFTRSKCASAPVEWCQSALKEERVGALVVNAGNANAFSGKKGQLSVDKIASYVAQEKQILPREIMLASTGVIGEPLDPQPVLDTLKSIQESAPADFEAAAGAIMTTDTYAKGSMAIFEDDGVEVPIVGIAKGSGMIAPDMATMLSFVFTDMAIAKPVLNQILQDQVKTSFNSITVDSDTSTSDTLIVFATGKSKNRGIKPIVSMDDARIASFSKALGDVLFDLAMQVVRDGEGATKFVEIEVTSAASDASAKTVAFSVANSPLVKTAIAGEDANWGRIVMAVGKAGEPADRDRLSIAFGDIVVAENGLRAKNYSEEAASQYMKNSELKISIDMGIGSGEARVFTCDLTHGYISINGDYRS
ncbi:MAG: bifunctional glutamate N-acetyltransferase/amino-acid acetyltransferase ArgJ [Devosiaceae bacterium]|nr:bifunctional glutamate N-acetyltransferase/amino-acid acetyltransferase ArgJ [Devosiaceae bacterium]